jgi:uncharacterized protein YjdB
MSKVLFAAMVSLLLLATSGCGRGSFGDNTSASRNYDVGDNSIQSIGGIGGDNAVSKPSVTPPKADDITVSPLSPSMAVDGKMQFTATSKDVSGEKFQWVSSRPSVATIDNNGVATGMGAGTTQITATAGGKTSPPVVLTLCDYRHT